MTKEQFIKCRDELGVLVRSNDPGLLVKLRKYISHREFIHDHAIDISPGGIVRIAERRILRELKSLIAPERTERNLHPHVNYSDMNIREFCDLDTIYISKHE